ncbi:lyase family protein, partial [Peribacillus sp. SIMBA_075]|uniref:lyase family protein n=1 Tax=Peribacillus sp. SIMBA_075 TaxID=3085813 RepID=UPI0039790CB5
LAVYKELVPASDQLRAILDEQAKAYQQIVKIGRTHLQDATPLTVGQEISGWVYMLDRSKEMILESTEKMRELAIGGTAVGTGINAHPEFGQYVAEEISQLTGQTFNSSPNKFHALT